MASIDTSRSIEKNCTLLINWDKGGTFNIAELRERLQGGDSELQRARAGNVDGHTLRLV